MSTVAHVSQRQASPSSKNAVTLGDSLLVIDLVCGMAVKTDPTPAPRNKLPNGAQGRTVSIARRGSITVTAASFVLGLPALNPARMAWSATAGAFQAWSLCLVRQR